MRRTAGWRAWGAGLLVLIASSPATARGLDCAKAVTSLERTICADPRLREEDATLAASYARAVNAYGGAIAVYVRRDQLAWLRDFRAIGRPDAENAPCELKDHKCILAEMHNRGATLFSVSYQHSGVYLGPRGLKMLLTPSRANGYNLRVYDPADAVNRNMMSDEGKWDGPDFMLATMGDANGSALPKALGGPDADGCTLRMLPSALQIRVWQTGYCLGRDWTGVYRRDLTQLLEDYQSDLH